MGMNCLSTILVGLTQTAPLTDGYFFVLAVVLQGLLFLRKSMAGFQLPLHAKQIFFRVSLWAHVPEVCHPFHRTILKNLCFILSLYGRLSTACQVFIFVVCLEKRPASFPYAHTFVQSVSNIIYMLSDATCRKRKIRF